MKRKAIARSKIVAFFGVCSSLLTPGYAVAAAEPATPREAAAASAYPGPAPLDAYGDLPGIEDVAISPNGKRLAILGFAQGERRLIVVEDGKVLAQAPVGAAKVRSVTWAGKDMVVLVNSATVNLGMDFTKSKLEFFGAVLVPLDGTQPQNVFAKSPQMVKAVFGSYGFREVDGSLTGYFGGIELRKSTASNIDYLFDHGRPALFGVDLKRNAPRKLARAASEAHWRDWIIDERGGLAATLDMGEGGRWSIDNAAGAPLAKGVEPEGDVSLISLGRDGSTLLYSVEDNDAEEVRWFEVALAGGEAKEVFADIDIESIYVDPANGRMLGYLPRDQAGKPVLFDAGQQNVLRKVYRAFPKLKVSVRGWTPTFSHVLVSTSGNGDSGTWYVVDIAKLKADPIGYERPAIGADRVGPISTFAYRAADGLDLDGILTLPPGREAKNLPIVVLPHGGPHARDEPAFDWWAQALASRGYAVFQPNFRGSTNRDTAFRRAGYGQWGRKMQTDISDGLAALAKQGVVDPKRACIAGASYGGYAALAGVTLQQGLYRCAVAVAPVSDLNTMYQTHYRESGGSEMVKRSLRESLGDPRTFPEVSPRRRAEQADAPILLIHGKDDTVVPFSQSSAMADALRSAGKPHELVVLREEDHWMSRPATRKQMLQETVAFIEKHNPAD